MKPEEEKRGEAVERIVADFSSMFFMKDFVFRKPSYITSGQTREVTDLMFLLNQDCIFVSIKGTDGNDRADEKLHRWAEKKARQSSKNAKTACQRAAKVDITATNLWGEAKTFAKGTLSPICGIGVIECSQEPFKQIDFDSPLHSIGKGAYPIHYLSANDFLNVSHLLGSIWDVFNYFKLRQNVCHLFNGINIERSLLCYYTLRSHSDFSEYAAEDKKNLEELHQLFMLDTLPKYADRDKFAGYVNTVVYQLHERHKDFENYAPEELRHMIEPSDNRKAYLEMATMLNMLPMSNKAWIGKRIEKCIALAKETGRTHSFHFKQLTGHVIFVFVVFTGRSRTEKMRALANLLPAAQYDTGMNESLGIAYDADDESIGFDLLWRRGPVIDTGSARRLASQYFGGTAMTISATPFGDSQPFKPKGKS